MLPGECASANSNHFPDGTEEIVLSNCNVLPSQVLETIGHATPEMMSAKLKAAQDCLDKQLDNLRDAAWQRENEDTLQAQCNYPGLTAREEQALVAFFKKDPDQRSLAPPSETQTISRLVDKANMPRNCRASVLRDFTIAAVDRWIKAPPGGSPPSSTTPNPFDLYEPKPNTFSK